jgi:hypothetical protein
LVVFQTPACAPHHDPGRERVVRQRMAQESSDLDRVAGHHLELQQVDYHLRLPPESNS